MLFADNSQDLFDRCLAFECFSEAILEHRSHAISDCRRFEVIGIGSFHDELTEFFIHLKDFIDADASGVAGVVTLLAPLAGKKVPVLIKKFRRDDFAQALEFGFRDTLLDTAMRADHAHEPLAYRDIDG